MKRLAQWCRLALITGLIALTGCQKETLRQAPKTDSQIEQLLQLPDEATSPALQSTTAHLRQQLQQHDYSADFIHRHGLPLWGKALQMGSDTNHFMLYVPLQLPGQSELSGFVAVRCHKGQFGYRLFGKAAVEAGTTGLPRWQPAFWLAQLEAKVSGRPVRLAHLWPGTLAKARGQGEQEDYFAVIEVDAQLIVQASCCIAIWDDLDGNPGNGNEYYSHHDCSGCVINSMDGVDGFAGGLGGGSGGTGGGGSGGVGGVMTNGVDSSVVNTPDFNLDGLSKICNGSFKFKKYIEPTGGVGGWQVAGTLDIHINIVDFITRRAIRLTLPTMYFGLPVIKASGEFYSTTTAASIAAEAVDWAEKQVMDRYLMLGGTLDVMGMTLFFRQKINERMQEKSGTASLIPGSNITITDYGMATYPWPIIGC